MTGQIVLESLTSIWGLAPVTSFVSPSPDGVAAALWKLPPSDSLELLGEPPADVNVISLCVAGRHRTTYWGDGCLRADTDTGPGNLNIVPAGERPRAVQRGGSRLEYLHIYVPRPLIDRVAEGMELSDCTLELVDPRFARDTAVEAVGKQILNEMRSCGPLHRLRIDTLGQDLAIQLIRRHSSVASAGGSVAARGGLAPWQLKRACEAMDAHLADDIGLAMLSEIAGCSPTHLSRAFKQSTGVPPFQWLLERRIERAQALLAHGELPLAEIALSVGFAAQAQFTTAFKRVTGETPGAWRRGRRT